TSSYCFFQTPWDHTHLHSFPTRRSSDLRFVTALEAIWARLRVLLPGDLTSRTSTGERLQAKYTNGLEGSSLTARAACLMGGVRLDRKSTRLNSSHVKISYAVFCLKKKKQ